MNKSFFCCWNAEQSFFSCQTKHRREQKTHRLKTGDFWRVPSVNDQIKKKRRQHTDWPQGKNDAKGNAHTRRAHLILNPHWIVAVNGWATAKMLLFYKKVMIPSNNNMFLVYLMPFYCFWTSCDIIVSEQFSTTQQRDNTDFIVLFRWLIFVLFFFFGFHFFFFFVV